VSLVEKALKKLQEQRDLAAVTGATAARRNAEVPHDPTVILTSPPAPVVRAEPQSAASAPSPVPPPAATPRNTKVVSIDRAALREVGLLAAAEDERRVASEYRQIKRPLIAAAMGRRTPAVPNGRAIMVASALPGEGKSFTSVNLALNMALEKDTTVLLVDADLPKPQVSRVFGVGEEPGLLDVLLDESQDVESVVIPTEVRGLSLLPAGRPTSTATELLASNRMERLLANLLSADPRRIVLFDSPPLLLTTEARALAGVVGQIVIVVRAESTTRQAVMEAIANVSEGKSVGLILNQSQSAPAHVYYGYGTYGDPSGSSD
jgi:protein-tyrosine kinase